MSSSSRAPSPDFMQPPAASSTSELFERGGAAHWAARAAESDRGADEHRHVEVVTLLHELKRTATATQSQVVANGKDLKRQVYLISRKLDASREERELQAIAYELQDEDESLTLPNALEAAKVIQSARREHEAFEANEQYAEDVQSRVSNLGARPCMHHV